MRTTDAEVSAKNKFYKSIFKVFKANVELYGGIIWVENLTET